MNASHSTSNKKFPDFLLESFFFSFLAKLGKSFCHLIYPPICFHCQESLECNFTIFCQSCIQLLEIINPQTRCLYCFTDDLNPEEASLCAICRQKPHLLHRMASVFDYEGPAATLIKQMKYAGQGYLAEGTGAFLALQLLHLGWPIPDYIIPVPMTALRRIDRGYNQSQLLADALAKLLQRPVLEPLVRKKGLFSQAGLTRKQRLQLDEDTFSLKNSYDLQGKNLLLIDDVMTTGATLHRCAEALVETYPHRIYALTVCRAI